jgi:hypothetical protein
MVVQLWHLFREMNKTSGAETWIGLEICSLVLCHEETRMRAKKFSMRNYSHQYLLASEKNNIAHATVPRFVKHAPSAKWPGETLFPLSMQPWTLSPLADQCVRVERRSPH